MPHRAPQLEGRSPRLGKKTWPTKGQVSNTTTYMVLSGLVAIFAEVRLSGVKAWRQRGVVRAVRHEHHAQRESRCDRERDRSHRCLLYTSDAADDLLCVDLGGRRI